MDYLDDFATSGAFLPKATVIVANHGLVLSGRSPAAAFAPVMASKVIEKAVSRGAVVVSMPSLTCMSEVTDRGLLFEDAAAGRVKPGQAPMALFDPTRVREWWTKKIPAFFNEFPAGVVAPFRRSGLRCPVRSGRPVDMKKVNRSHAKLQRPAASKMRVQQTPEGWTASIGHPSTSPSSDPPELAWRLVRRAHHEDTAVGRGGHWRMLTDVLCAQRVVLTSKFALLAENLRTEDLGVTVTTTDQARFPSELSWWEWDARIPGRIGELRPNDMDCDRTGALVVADESGRKGMMHFVAGVVGPDGVAADILPFAAHFDWRESFEPPPTIVPRATIEETRRALRAVAEPTMAESEASPVVGAALVRRFGVVESPYVAAEYARLVGGAASPWYMVNPEMFADSVRDTMQEALFLLAGVIVMRTAPLVVTQVLRGVENRRDVVGGKGCALRVWGLRRP